MQEIGYTFVILGSIGFILELIALSYLSIVPLHSIQLRVISRGCAILSAGSSLLFGAGLYLLHSLTAEVQVFLVAANLLLLLILPSDTKGKLS